MQNNGPQLNLIFTFLLTLLRPAPPSSPVFSGREPRSKSQHFLACPLTLKGMT